MKQLVILFLLLPLMGWGQTVGTYDIGKDTTVKYIKVRLVDMGSKNKIEFLAYVDYGKVPEGSTSFVLDPGIYKTEMQMVNHLSTFGWVLMYESAPFVFVFRRSNIGK